jgi:hypothetical protein
MSERNKADTVVLAICTLMIVLLLGGPICTIWSLNTLFSLEIPYTFETWAAVIWLMTVFHGIRITLSKRD